MASLIRDELLDVLVDEIDALPGDPFVRVAVDGVDGSGKSVLADELGALLRARGRSVVRASVDGFHNPRAVRYARGRTSPEGFYRDSYDLGALVRELLAPLGEGGSGLYRSTVFDLTTDVPAVALLEEAAPGTLLILDGIFLHRQELAPVWTWSVWLEVDRSVALARCVTRDGAGSSDPAAAANRRYVDGQELYRADALPQERATHVIENTDLAAPRLLR